MTANRLQRLHDAGQSIWLDFIDREILLNGEVARRIRDDALTGMTSNPTIFEKALAEGNEYDEQLSGAPRDFTAWQLFELVETEDVRTACDLFRGVYDTTNGADGYVSIEISPGVSHDPTASLEEAKRLWQAVDRPNVMIKVPGTEEGAKVVRALISEGINVNITLLFAVEAHQRVIYSYLDALEERVRRGQPVDRIASVASFFVSRVDTETDKRLEKLAEGESGAERERILGLRGKAAVANAKLAYELFRKMFSGGRWEALAARGARLQRPLWASTGTKNPAYSDVLYVEELIGPDSVNTMTPATIDAFRDHGEVRRTVDHDVDGARRIMSDLAKVGIDFNDVTATLLTQGIASFQKSFDSLIAGLGRKSQALGRELSMSR